MPARILIIACCCLGIVGCASNAVESTIETHHRLSQGDRSKSIIVLPAQEEKNGTLEFAEYAKFVEDGFRREGFQVAPPGEPPDLVAFFGYAMDQGRDELYSYAIPQFGQTGVQSSQTFGTVQSYGYGTTYSGTTTYTPSYGITGWTPQVGTRRVFARVAILDIYDLSRGDEPVKVYESIITSLGSSAVLGNVIDEMVASLFKDFEATGVRTTSVELGP
jgi:hypothetical protein